MREILFRGKRVDNGEWVEGYYGEFHNRPTRQEENSCQIFEPKEDAYLFRSCIGGLWHIVERKTVGQYTGMTDKNGTKIFEGDIIKSDNGKQSAISVVRFGEYCPKMFYKMLDMLVPGEKHIPAVGFYAKSVGKGEEMILLQSPCVTVIGNIHDNP